MIEFCHAWVNFLLAYIEYLVKSERRLTRSRYLAKLTRRLTRSRANEIIFQTKKYSGLHFEFCHVCVN
uniref:Uncharacterized protein n=1 Tax=Trichogramma kaykai TaxID=54128 RepID=A0ABD2WAL9_9HYME